MGEGCFPVPVASSLPMAGARRILNATLAAVRGAELLPLAVCVRDAGGQLAAPQREDGCGVMRFEIAREKAHGALGMGVGSRTPRERLKERIAFQASIAAVSVFGDASDRDEYAATAGVHAAGFAAHANEPASNWKEAGL
jgi:uncharacterized protein GlcG (DUF336 family)